MSPPRESRRDAKPGGQADVHRRGTPVHSPSIARAGVRRLPVALKVPNKLQRIVIRVAAKQSAATGLAEGVSNSRLI